MSYVFIIRRLKPTVNQVFSLQENWVETWHAASLHAAMSCKDITLLTVEFILRNEKMRHFIYACYLLMALILLLQVMGSEITVVINILLFIIHK